MNQLSVWEQYANDLLPKALDFLVQILLAVIILFIGSKIIKLVQNMAKKSMERHNTDPSVSSFLGSLTKYALYFVLIMVILSLFGVTTSSAVAVLGSAGLTVGLALQGSLQNFAGGVLILILKPFKVGDYIIDTGSGSEGTVAEISIYYTKLTTIDNRVIMIPNGTLTTNSIVNVSMNGKRRLDLTVGVAYDSDLAKTKEVLLNVLKTDDAVLKDEECLVFVSELADSSVNMGLRFWVKKEDYWTSKWRVLENVKIALDKNGISIPFPQLDVQIKQ